MRRIVLFDFHNTLVTCDAWLELEIKTLPALVLRKLALQDVLTTGGELEAEATRLFKDVRQRARESGVEVSALEGTLEVLYEMGIHAPVSTVEAAIEHLEEGCLSTVAIMPGAAPALEKLRSGGCLMGVVSSAGYPPFVELALESVGLRPYFSEVLTSAGEGIYKSTPEIFLRAVHRLGGVPSEAVHVGDHPVFDVAAAKDAGLATIWLVANAKRTAEIRGEPWREEELAKAGADAVIESMAELYDAYRRID